MNESVHRKVRSLNAPFALDVSLNIAFAGRLARD